MKKLKPNEPYDFKFDFKPWQYALLARLGVIEDRKIIWILDKEGGNGKTRFASWLGTF